MPDDSGTIRIPAQVEAVQVLQGPENQRRDAKVRFVLDPRGCPSMDRFTGHITGDERLPLGSYFVEAGCWSRSCVITHVFTIAAV
ncbi:hypothetical protein ABZ467_39210 [Streptomyces sp. NPDC005727]|uniref:hypothetical protein n=1 Tax=unclassified Streptomyces TaxID=2593676 RepID=UPI003411F39C